MCNIKLDNAINCVLTGVFDEAYNNNFNYLKAVFDKTNEYIVENIKYNKQLINTYYSSESLEREYKITVEDNEILMLVKMNFKYYKTCYVKVELKLDKNYIFFPFDKNFKNKIEFNIQNLLENKKNQIKLLNVMKEVMNNEYRTI